MIKPSQNRIKYPIFCISDIYIPKGNLGKNKSKQTTLRDTLCERIVNELQTLPYGEQGLCNSREKALITSQVTGTGRTTQGAGYEVLAAS